MLLTSVPSENRQFEGSHASKQVNAYTVGVGFLVRAIRCLAIPQKAAGIEPTPSFCQYVAKRNSNMEEKLKSRFLGLYCMILADGVVDSRELETIYRIGRENYGFSEEEIMSTVRDSGTSFVMPEALREKIELLYQMGEVAWADGEIEESERILMCKYASRMGFADENLNGIVDYILEKVNSKVPVDDVIKEVIGSK